MLLNKASCAIDAWETTTLVLVVHAHTTIFYTEGAIKVDTQSNDSSEQKAPPAKREPSQQLQVNTLNGHSKTLKTMCVQMELESLDGSTKVKINAYTANRVTGKMRVIDWRPFAKKWKLLRYIAFPNIGPRPVGDILIGIDYAELRCILEEVKGDPGDPIAPRIPLGWTCNW